LLQKMMQVALKRKVQAGVVPPDRAGSAGCSAHLVDSSPAAWSQVLKLQHLRVQSPL